MTEKNLKPYIIGAKIALYHEATKKFLILKANKPKGKQYEEFWKTYFPYDLPGGRIENGETVQTGFERDVTEEIGEDVTYTLSDIVHAEQMEYVDATVYATFTLGLYHGGEVALSQEHSEYSWMTAEEVAGHPDIKPWLKTTIAKAAERLQEKSYLADIKRTQADFENYKRRQQENQAELKGFLIQKVVTDITPVLDNFYQATSFIPNDQKDTPFITGIMYIQKQLEDALKNHGLEIIEVKEGDPFNPNLHEALEGDGDQVSQVLSPGYKIGGRVIKPAKVKVRGAQSKKSDNQ